LAARPTAKPAPDGPRWLDRELSDERSFIAGEQVSMADICVLSTVDFAHWIGCRSMRTVRI
jgi:glutathione S-transferase